MLTTYDAILSWMIEMWMNTTWSVRVIATLYLNNPPKKKLQGLTNHVGLAFSVGDTVLQQLTSSIEQVN